MTILRIGDFIWDSSDDLKVRAVCLDTVESTIIVEFGSSIAPMFPFPSPPVSAYRYSPILLAFMSILHLECPYTDNIMLLAVLIVRGLRRARGHKTMDTSQPQDKR